ncbi:DUF1294 domain-containing protein [Asticcacaulis solisilvae]|uniref:DUF1294 domain-containing protein n=1 Tax=Asticcacaulis solisilvae TaxID=1217274 RepID=UPI003FD843CE
MLLFGLAIYAAIVNFVTWHAWVHDKRSAAKRGRRTPENTLLWLCLLGGWPAALLASRQFRHKTVKAAFLGRMYAMIALNVAMVSALLALTLRSG